MSDLRDENRALEDRVRDLEAERNKANGKVFMLMSALRLIAEEYDAFVSSSVFVEPVGVLCAMHSIATDAMRNENRK